MNLGPGQAGCADPKAQGVSRVCGTAGEARLVLSISGRGPSATLHWGLIHWDRLRCPRILNLSFLMRVVIVLKRIQPKDSCVIDFVECPFCRTMRAATESRAGRPLRTQRPVHASARPSFSLWIAVPDPSH